MGEIPRHTIASLGLLLSETKEILPNPAAGTSTPLPSLLPEVSAVAAHPTLGTSQATRNYIVRARAQVKKMKKREAARMLAEKAQAAEEALVDTRAALAKAQEAASAAMLISTSLNEANEKSKNVLCAQMELWLTGKTHPVTGEAIDAAQAASAAKALMGYIVKVGGPITEEDAGEAKSVVFEEAVQSIRGRLATRLPGLLLVPEGEA